MRLLLEVERQQVHAVAGQRVALGARVAACDFAALFSAKPASRKRTSGMSRPSSQTTGSLAVVAVVVEGPRRGDDEVAVAHRRALAVDRGVGALAVEHQAQRRLGVAVRRRHLAGQDQLQAGVERLGDARLAAQGRVLEDQDAPLGLLGGDQAAGFHHVLAHLVVAPERRRDRAGRLRRHQRAQHLPERRHAERADPLVEVAPRFGAARGEGSLRSIPESYSSLSHRGAGEREQARWPLAASAEYNGGQTRPRAPP